MIKRREMGEQIKHTKPEMQKTFQQQRVREGGAREREREREGGGERERERERERAYADGRN